MVEICARTGGDREMPAPANKDRGSILPAISSTISARRAWISSSNARATTSWKTAIDRYPGVGQVPLLTITKSKGLEYDLVVLLGLNDNEWWSFARDDGDGEAATVASDRAGPTM
jgi:superfamily I DNA/RNA helicase